MPTAGIMPMASRAPAPLTRSKRCRGSSPPPVKAASQEGWGFLKTSFTVWESIRSIRAMSS